MNFGVLSFPHKGLTDQRPKKTKLGETHGQVSRWKPCSADTVVAVCVGGDLQLIGRLQTINWKEQPFTTNNLSVSLIIFGKQLICLGIFTINWTFIDGI